MSVCLSVPEHRKKYKASRKIFLVNSYVIFFAEAKYAIYFLIRSPPRAVAPFKGGDKK